MTMKTFKNVDNELHVVVGQKFEVVLAVNATTGFIWNVVEKSDGCAVLDSTFKPASESMIGGGGTQHIIMTAERPGPHHVSVSLFQPWNPADVDKQRTIKFVASEAEA